MKDFEYCVGSKITYLTWGDTPRQVIVDVRMNDIKNGKSGFDGTIVGSGKDGFAPETVWGYDNQIISVDKY